MSKIIDLTGKRFGKLTVITFSHTNKHRQSYWLCSCDCGQTKTVNGQSLRQGKTNSCGCNRAGKVGKKPKNLDGLNFGLLTVLNLSHVDKFGQKHWVCSCACGKTTTKKGSNLVTGHTKSCGCLRGKK